MSNNNNNALNKRNNEMLLFAEEIRKKDHSKPIKRGKYLSDGGLSGEPSPKPFVVTPEILNDWIALGAPLGYDSEEEEDIRKEKEKQQQNNNNNNDDDKNNDNNNNDYTPTLRAGDVISFWDPTKVAAGAENRIKATITYIFTPKEVVSYDYNKNKKGLKAYGNKTGLFDNYIYLTTTCPFEINGGTGICLETNSNPDFVFAFTTIASCILIPGSVELVNGTNQQLKQLINNVNKEIVKYQIHENQ